MTAGSPQPTPRKKQATAIEIAALLMEAVCVPASSEQEALQELASYLDAPLDRMQAELMFLRAFAIDFALRMSLGDGPARWEIAEQYFHHWEMIAEKTDDRTMDDLHERLKYYVDVVNNSHTAAAGLTEQIGMAFASHCTSPHGDDECDDATIDLAMLGGSMFVALFDEVSDMLTHLDIILLDP